MSDLYLCTTLARTDADGDTADHDVLIAFIVTRYRPGYPASQQYPGDGADYECAFAGAELDHEPTDAPAPLTAAELATLRTWFAANHDAACERAGDVGWAA